MSTIKRQLILLRHAKSSWKSDIAEDFDRPLTKRGKQDATRVGLWLKRRNLIPDLILSSPAKRARKTTLKICGELRFDTDNVRWIPEIYDASLRDLIGILTRCPDHAKFVLLVGHNPGLEDLLEYLCREALPLAEDGKLLTTACAAHLNIPNKWRDLTQSAAQLISITQPGEMNL